jgi:hypothetical protein
MTDTQIYWLYYAFFLVIRVPSNLKRCRLPLMRGPGYFYNTRVPPDFFAGPGRDILLRYRLWIFAPFLFDALALLLIYRFAAPRYLPYLALADILLTVGNHIAALKRAIREVKPFATEDVQPVSAVAFSLTTRRLRDYTSIPLELVIASFNIRVLQVLYGQPWQAFSGAIILFYVQAGLLLLKRALIAGRTALPQENAEQYLEWREAYRRLMTDSCDAVRLLAAGAVLVAVFDVDRTQMLIAIFVALALWTAWYWRRLRRFMALYTAAKPVKLPGALEPEEAVPPVVCFRPESPLSFVKGARGWALNLANRRSQIGVAYLVGLVVVRVFLR